MIGRDSLHVRAEFGVFGQFLFVVIYHLAVAVHNAQHSHRLRPHTVVSKCAVHFYHFVQADIGGTEADAVFAGQFGGDAHLGSQVYGVLYAHFFDELRGHHINGTGEGACHRVIAAVPFICIVRLPVNDFCYFVWEIGARLDALLQSGGIYDGLESGADLPRGFDVVEFELSEIGAAHPSAHIAVAVVHGHESAVEHAKIIAHRIERGHGGIYFRAAFFPAENGHFGGLFKFGQCLLFVEPGFFVRLPTGAAPHPIHHPFVVAPRFFFLVVFPVLVKLFLQILHVFLHGLFGVLLHF